MSSMKGSRSIMSKSKKKEEPHLGTEVMTQRNESVNDKPQVIELEQRSKSVIDTQTQKS